MAANILNDSYFRVLNFANRAQLGKHVWRMQLQDCSSGLLPSSLGSGRSVSSFTLALEGYSGTLIDGLCGTKSLGGFDVSSLSGGAGASQCQEK